MPSSYSTNLKIELQATGENSGTWGTITNTNLGTALEQAIVGYGNPSYASDANLTLTYTDTNAAQAARALVLNVTSAVSLTATRELVVPTIQKQYIVQNNTTGSQSITVKTSAGTGITVPNGRKAHLYVDGTNVIYMDDYVDINGGAIDGTPIGANSASTGAFTTLSASGNITVSGGTANGVLYLNGSKVATSGSALVFDGTNLGVGVTPSAWTVIKAVEVGGTGGNYIGGSSTNLYLGANNFYDGAYKYKSNGFASQIQLGAGTVQFYTAPSGTAGGTITFSETMRVDASGNLGLGVTPSAWTTASGRKAIEIGALGNAMFGNGASDFYMLSNAYRTASNFIYANNGPAAAYRHADAAHQWFSAASGTAGNTISFTQAMTLDASGNLGIGTSSPAYKLDVSGTARISNGGDTYVGFGANKDNYWTTGTTSGVQVWRNSAGSEFMRLDSSGNLGLGVTPSAWFSNRRVMQLGGGASLAGVNSAEGFELRSNAYLNASGSEIYQNTDYAALYASFDGKHIWYNAPSGTAGNTISFTQAMTLDASGNLSFRQASQNATTDINFQNYLGNTVHKITFSDADGSFSIGGNNGSSNFALKFNTGTAERARITSDGKFGLNTTNPQALLDLQTATGVNAIAMAAWPMLKWDTSNEIAFGGYTANQWQVLKFFTAATERARITAGGYWKASNAGTYFDSTGAYHELRQTADNAGVQISSTAATLNNTIVTIRASANTSNNTFHAIDYYNDGAAAYKFRVADSGNVTNTNGSYGTISDAKMKTDIVDAGSQWGDIKAVRFRKFKMKDDPSGLMQLGVVAQELEQTSPGLVDEHADRDAEGNDLGTTTKSVKTSVLLMKAAVALQEAMARIEQLEAKVAALETK